MTRLVCGALLALSLLAGCASGSGGGEDDEPSLAASSTEQEYAESEQCRTDAQEVLDILGLALQDRDVRDAAGRLLAVEKLMPEAVSLCSGEVSRATNEDYDNLGDALDAVISGNGNAGKSMVEAYKHLQTAQEGLNARR